MSILKYLMEELNSNSKAKFLGVCDEVRSRPAGESFWQKMMNNKKEISEKDFINNVDITPILDDDESWEDFKSGISDDITFYESFNNIYFFQTAGFEFIWTRDGQIVNEENIVPVPELEKVTKNDAWFKYASPNQIISLVKNNYDILPIEKFNYSDGFEPDGFLKTYQAMDLKGYHDERRKWHMYQGEQMFGNYPIRKWFDFLVDIAENGLKESILLTSDGSKIIEGNHRVQALRQLGHKLVPIRYEKD